MSDPWIGKIPWRREWLPSPVFWPGEFHGLYSPWGHKESDMIGQLSLSLSTKTGERIAFPPLHPPPPCVLESDLRFLKDGKEGI